MFGNFTKPGQLSHHWPGRRWVYYDIRFTVKNGVYSICFKNYTQGVNLKKGCTLSTFFIGLHPGCSFLKRMLYTPFLTVFRNSCLNSIVIGSILHRSPHVHMYGCDRFVSDSNCTVLNLLRACMYGQLQTFAHIKGPLIHTSQPNRTRKGDKFLN